MDIVGRDVLLPGVSRALQFRAIVAVAVVVISGIGTEGISILPWVAVVLVLDIGCELVLRRGSGESTALMVSGAVAGSVVAGLALHVGPSALPLVVIPWSRAYETSHLRGLAAAVAAWMAAAAGVAVWWSPRDLSDVSLLLRWAAIAAVVGVGAVWVSRTAAPVPPVANRAASEAASLLTRLDSVTHDLQGGLDPATAAEHLLDTLGRPGPMARSAVLVGSPSDAPVPLALRGADRVPWGDPTLGSGAVGRAWRHAETAVEWNPATHREVRAVPLRTNDGVQIGILVQDVMATAPSDRDDLADVWDVAERHGPVIGVALDFASLRERAGFEERERLAREMHDGIAQELVALGFQLDLVLRTLSAETPEQTRPMLEQARAQLRRVLGDLRSQISDLRMSVRPDRGLGATMSSRLQSFGTAHQVVVSLRLDESPFRLPARVETVLYQLFLDVLTDVREGGASGVDVDLSVAAPEAFLRMRHDGRTTFTSETFSDHPVTEAGGECVLSTDEGLDLAVAFHAPQTVITPVHLDQKVPQAS